MLNVSWSSCGDHISQLYIFDVLDPAVLNIPLTALFSVVCITLKVTLISIQISNGVENLGIGERLAYAVAYVVEPSVRVLSVEDHP